MVAPTVKLDYNVQNLSKIPFQKFLRRKGFFQKAFLCSLSAYISLFFARVQSERVDNCEMQTLHAPSFS